MEAYWGSAFYQGTRNDGAGAITAVTYKTPLIFPFFDGIDVAGGAAGGGPLIRSRLAA